MIDFDNIKNWKEDYSHENGQYSCRCFLCKEMFIGHKRRVICKTCANRKTLHLNLKKKWFYMILAEIKKEEYREIKESFVAILTDIIKSFHGYKKSRYALVFAKGLKGSNINAIKYLVNELKVLDFKTFDTITFSNGYSKKRPQFEIELKGIRIGKGKQEWGAIPDTDYFILELGNILQRNTGLDNFISCQ